MRKLSQAQQKVIDLLKEKDCYIQYSDYYHFQEVVSRERVISEWGVPTYLLHYFNLPTLLVLIRLGVIILSDEKKGIYLLANK